MLAVKRYASKKQWRERTERAKPAFGLAPDKKPEWYSMNKEPPGNVL